MLFRSKAVLQDEGLPLTRERKSSDDTPWKKQTVFVEEVEDESWLEYNLKEKSATSLMYEVGHEDDEPLTREAYSAHKTNHARHENGFKSSPKSNEANQGDSSAPSSRPSEAISIGATSSTVRAEIWWRMCALCWATCELPATGTSTGSI